MFAGASLDENSGAFCELKANFFRLILTKAEALALEWCDLDLKHEKLRVYKTLNRVTKYYDSKGNELPERYSTIQITTPKKSASNRKVPLTDAVIAALKKISRSDFYNIFRKKLSSIISSNRMQADCWDC